MDMLERLKDKYVFFDVDGTLSEYRYNDCLYSSKNSEIGSQTLKALLFENLYLKARPLKTMQRIIEKLDSDKIFILGAACTNNEIEHKYEWLTENFLNIKRENMFFIHSTMLKPEVIVECANYFDIKLSDTVFVDDRLEVLQKAELMGITAYHPSSFTE